MFGKVKLAKVVLDFGTGKPKGTGFVQFFKREDADRVLELVEAAGPPPVVEKKYARGKAKAALARYTGIELNGRPLNITRAVDRSEAKQLEESNKQKKEKEDKRNMYLAREGLIQTDSPAAADMSKHDLEKRKNAWKEKRMKLKNPNFFISKTRLSIRNLPADMDEKQLKKIFLDACKGAEGPKTPFVKQVKIVRDKERLDNDGKAKSKRYGFIEFGQHEHAIHALRQLNNNPTTPGFTKDRRPIVEFALDDHRKLLVRQKRLERTQQKTKQKVQLEKLTKAEQKSSLGDKKTNSKSKPRNNKTEEEGGDNNKKSNNKKNSKVTKPPAGQEEGAGEGEQQDMKQEKCRKCKKTGHRAKECPNANLCFKCGEPGHKGSNCPNKKPKTNTNTNTNDQKQNNNKKNNTNTSTKNNKKGAPSPSPAPRPSQSQEKKEVKEKGSKRKPEIDAEGAKSAKRRRADEPRSKRERDELEGEKGFDQLVNDFKNKYLDQGDKSKRWFD